MKLLLLFIALLPSICFSETIIGTWEGSHNNEEKVYSIKIKKVNKEFRLSYVFIFSSGRKINEYSDEMKPLILEKIGSVCYKGQALDSHTSENADIVLCMNKGDLYWSKISNVNTPYIPNYERFILSNTKG